jgi:hypothetical protein
MLFSREKVSRPLHIQFFLVVLHHVKSIILIFVFFHVTLDCVRQYSKNNVISPHNFFFYHEKFIQEIYFNFLHEYHDTYPM